MNRDRRELTDLEKAECAALKAEIAVRNAQPGGGRKLTQECLAQELGMTQGNLSSHLNGKRALSKEMAAKMAILLGIPVERFSSRLAAEIAEMATAVNRPDPGQTPDGSRKYQDDLYEAAPATQRADVDELADKMLRLSPEQARKLKQAMDLLIPDNGSGKS